MKQSASKGFPFRPNLFAGQRVMQFSAERLSVEFRRVTNSDHQLIEIALAYLKLWKKIGKTN